LFNKFCKHLFFVRSTLPITSPFYYTDIHPMALLLLLLSLLS